mgnify:CR=1 FL=1
MYQAEIQAILFAICRLCVYKHILRNNIARFAYQTAVVYTMGLVLVHVLLLLIQFIDCQQESALFRCRCITVLHEIFFTEWNET